MACNLQTIKLNRGDSSNFFYSITVTIDTNLDLTGWSGYFEIGNSTATPVEGVENKQISIVVDSANTSKLKLGKNVAYLKLITNTGLIGTLEPLFVIDVIDEKVHI